MLSSDVKSNFNTCISSLCSISTATDSEYEKYAKNSPAIDSDTFEFYRPYDPLCPDRKRDGECLEITTDSTPSSIK